MEIESIFQVLSFKLKSWVMETSFIFETALKKATASVNWGFVNKQISRKIEKWYDMLQDALDDAEAYLFENDLEQITPEIEERIRAVFGPKLEDYQKSGKEMLVKYEAVLGNLDQNTVTELKDLIFEISVDNILNILKEMLNG